MKWIEDDDKVVAKQANEGLKDLIDTGVFKTLSSECKDDVLYITGEQDELDKAVMKIQKAYAKYGQIMIKEAKKEGGLKIESFDDNVQEIFDYTVNEYNKLNKNSTDTLIMWHLEDYQLEDYVRFLVRKLKMDFSKELQEDIHKNDLSDNLIDDIISSSYLGSTETDDDGRN